MKDIIEKLRYEKVEHLYVIVDGKVIYHEIGFESNVEIDNSLLETQKDVVIIHNHPNRSSFSEADIENILKFNVRKMILVTYDYIYSIERNGINWNLDFNKLKILIQRSDNWANLEIENLLIKNSIEYNDANVEKSHYIWVSIFTLLEIKYGRQRFENFIKKGHF